VAKFSVLVFGDNFQLPVEGEAEPCRAFLVWRCVEARSESEAIELAFDSVLGDPKMAGVEPRLKVEEIHEVANFGDLKPPGSGFILMGPTG
jgi:hypothetical protein